MAGRKNKKVAGSYFVSTISISLVLVVIGLLTFILLNARSISDYVKQNVGFTIIIKDNVNEAEIKRVQKLLDTKPFVNSSIFISKEEAAKSFKEDLGEDFEEILGYNPLKPSLEIKLNPAYSNNDSLAVIEQSLYAYDIIHEVSYQKSLVEYINKNIKKISIGLLITIGLLILISFTLIRNTIHLSVYAQRFLIKTMQLVGAKATFICKPFIRNSVWIGFFGSIIANLIILAGIYFLQKEVGEIIDVTNKEILIIMVGFVFVSGIFLSLFSSWLSVLKYLRTDLNDLYG